MQFEGDRDFPQPAAEVWAKLSDAVFLSSCLSGVEVVRAEADAAEWKVRPALSFASGTLDISLTIVERIAPSALRTRLFSKGIGATTTVTSHLTFAPHDTGTRVHWQAEITELTGLLKVVPKGLIQAAARKVIDDVWGQIGQKMTVAGS